MKNRIDYYPFFGFDCAQPDLREGHSERSRRVDEEVILKTILNTVIY